MDLHDNRASPSDVEDTELHLKATEEQLSGKVQFAYCDDVTVNLLQYVLKKDYEEEKLQTLVQVEELNSVHKVQSHDWLQKHFRALVPGDISVPV